VQVSPDEARAVKENHGAAKRLAQEILESDEHLSIKCAVPSKRNHDGGSIGTPSCAARSLHVVGRPRRHVSENDPVQPTDVDAEFHRSRR
jgi:hypothetical protein